MNHLRKPFATKALLIAAMLMVANLAWSAQVAGTVTRLSGPLLAKKADGSAKILSLKSEIEQGDTLVTEKNTYAQVKFIDDSEITLKPASSFKVEAFAFDAGKPEEDSAAFNLLKGGLRSVSGTLGKRNKEKFAMKTPTATIGIRGTIFTADYVPEDAVAVAALQAWLQASTADASGRGVTGVVPLQLAQNGPPKPVGLPPGLYVAVTVGAINLTNSAGTSNFAAGQFGYTANLKTPPIVLPANPGLKFTPPPAFAAPATSSGNSPPKAAAVDCEVR